MSTDLAKIKREMIESRNGMYLGDPHSLSVFVGLLVVGSVIVGSAISNRLSPVVVVSVVVPLAVGGFNLYNLLRVRSLDEISRQQWWAIGTTVVVTALFFAVFFGWLFPVL